MGKEGGRGFSEVGGRFGLRVVGGLRGGEGAREPSRSHAKLASLPWVRFHWTFAGSEWKRMNCVGKEEAVKVFRGGKSGCDRQGWSRHWVSSLKDRRSEGSDFHPIGVP